MGLSTTRRNFPSCQLLDAMELCRDKLLEAAKRWLTILAISQRFEFHTNSKLHLDQGFGVFLFFFQRDPKGSTRNVRILF